MQDFEHTYLGLLLETAKLRIRAQNRKLVASEWRRRLRCEAENVFGLGHINIETFWVMFCDFMKNFFLARTNNFSIVVFLFEIRKSNTKTNLYVALQESAGCYEYAIALLSLNRWLAINAPTPSVIRQLLSTEPTGSSHTGQINRRCNTVHLPHHPTSGSDPQQQQPRHLTAESAHCHSCHPCVGVMEPTILTRYC